MVQHGVSHTSFQAASWETYFTFIFSRLATIPRRAASSWRSRANRTSSNVLEETEVWSRSASFSRALPMSSETERLMRCLMVGIHENKSHHEKCNTGVTLLQPRLFS